MTMWPPASMLREGRLTEVVQTVADDTRPNVHLAPEMEPGVEGEHYGWGLHVLERLSDPDAEATALHELAHIYLCHDDDPALKATPRGPERAPWELEADALAAAMVEGRASVMTDAAASLDNLCRDAALYPIDPSRSPAPCADTGAT